MKILISTICIFSACINDVWIKFTLAIVSVKFDSIPKPPSDRRSYRGLVLSNGLRVLLVSDRSAEKSAVAMSVGVGALDDTLDVPGLANLMALVLMRGSTERYPTLGDFENLLRRNGGALYAPKVEANEQIFSFGVKPSRLAGALEKFVHYFIKPKFSSSASILEEALQVVEQEYKERSLEDDDRIFEIEKSMGTRNDLYSHFYIGTRQLFYQHAKKSPRISLAKRVKKFYERWYSSNIMCLVVLGKENLDDLQKIVAPIFVNIVNRNVEPISFEFRHHPWGPESLGHKVYVEPLTEDTKYMRLIFPVPNDRSSSKYISYFLTHGGEGSLSHLLQKTNLCVDMDADFVCTRGISFFFINCDLSSFGLTFNVDHIIYMTFQYLNLLDPDDLPKWIFEENLRSFRLAFFNMKPDYEPTISLVQNLASEMQVHPLEDILMHEYIHTQWNPSLVKEFLAYLKPEKMNVMVVGPNVNEIELDREEKYYGTKYAVRRLAGELIEACNTKEMIPELQFPRPNEFLSENFFVYPIRMNERKYPYKLYESQKYEIWFSQDQEFRTPDLLIQFQLFTSLARFDPFGSVSWAIFGSLLKGAINSRLGYNASMASMEQQIDLRESEMHVRVWGYSDKLPILLEKILTVITNFRDNCADDDLTLARFNLERLEKAMEVVGILEKSFGSSSGLLQQEVMLRNRYVQIADGSHLILQEFSEKTTYGYSSFFQLHTEPMSPKNVTAYVLIELILQYCDTILAKEKDEVQNESSLNNNCNLLESRGFRGIMIILSRKENPRFMDRRLEIFLRDMKDMLRVLPNAQFQSLKKNVQEKRNEKSSYQFDLISNLYWEPIESRHYQFEKFKVERELLLSLKIKDLSNYFQEMLALESPRRRKLVVHVFPENYPKTGVNRFIPVGATKIEDVTIFKNSSYLLPTH